MINKILANLRVFALASLICLLTLYLSRYISPRAILMVMTFTSPGFR